MPVLAIAAIAIGIGFVVVGFAKAAAATPLPSGGKAVDIKVGPESTVDQMMKELERLSFKLLILVKDFDGWQAMWDNQFSTEERQDLEGYGAAIAKLIGENPPTNCREAFEQMQMVGLKLKAKDYQPPLDKQIAWQMVQMMKYANEAARTPR